MIKNKIYKFISSILITVIVLCSVNINAFADDDMEFPTLGYDLEMVCYDNGLITDDVECIDFDYEEMLEYSAEYYLEAASSSDVEFWESLDTEYYYNQLKSDYEREFWKGLEAACDKVLYNNNDVKDYGSYYGTDYVVLRGYSGVNNGSEYTAFKDRAAEIVKMFYASYPQYYFIENGFGFGGSMTNGVYTYSCNVAVYNDFATGTNRSTATEAYKSAINEAIASIDKTDQLGTIKQIHDYICGLTEYNHDAADRKVEEEVSKSQSGYSCFVMHNTVCSGYAHATQALCNYFEIDAIEVVSSNHAWNVVKCNDNWYQIDTTWADLSSGVYYNYYMKSYSNYQSKSSHIILQWLQSYVPPATMDSSASGYNGNNVTIPGVTDSISTSSVVAASGDGYQVTLSSEAGASIYYTLDGSTPDEAKTKCFKYTVPINVKTTEAANAIKFIAVCDKYLDSAVTSVNGNSEIKRSIEVYGSQGKSSADTIEFDMYFAIDKNTYSDNTVAIHVYNSSNEESVYSISNLTSSYSSTDQKYIVVVPATVKPKEMSNNCSVQFFSGSTAISEKFEMKFASYLSSVMKKYSTDSKEYQVALELAKLGDAAQSYFSYNLSDPVKNYTSVTADTSSSGDSSIVNSLNTSHTPSFKDTSDVMDIVGVSLSLKDKVSINYYFYVDDSFKISSFSGYKGENINVEKVGDHVVKMSVSGIPYTDAAKTYHYQLYYDSSLAMEIDYSMTDYIAAALSGGTSDDSLKTLCRTMYLFTK